LSPAAARVRFIVIGISGFLFVGSPAAAQVSATVSLDSDYRLRGYTLTHGQPALGASLAWDSAAGPYVGGSVIASSPADGGVRSLGYLAYAGYARRTAGGASWDLGIADTRLHDEYGRYRTPIRYTELYAGVSTDHVTLHALYSPDYIASGVKSLYLDLSAASSPWRGWRALGHVGALTILDGRVSPGERPARIDLRAGVSREFRRSEVHLAWVMRGPGGDEQNRSGLVLGANYHF
jgi:uncharacterized protein (TIGR02001 family)